MGVEKKVKAFIEKQNLIEEGDRILLGLSGGADSVCLFYLLLGLREEIGFTLQAAHVHHGIRAEAEEDAAYVEALCKKEGVCCHLFREDVPAYAEKQGLGEEEAGRILRYADFGKSLTLWREKEQEAVRNSFRYKIATAHHENDQAETVLFQMFRGCGLAGLRGILPKRDHIIRPLLCLSREEIECYLREKGISWREDETNQEGNYSRNKIRHQILSYVEREVNCGVAAHIAKTAEIVREAEDYIKRQIREAYGRMTAEGKGCVVFDIPTLHREDAFLQKQLLLYGFGRVSAVCKDIGAVHVEDVLKLSKKQGNGELCLPGGIKARKSYQKLAIFWGDFAPLPEHQGFLCGEEVPMFETEVIDLAEEDAVKKRFDIREISEILHCIPQKTYTKWFDYDKIKVPPSFRRPESGDYLTIDGEMNHKSFRRYMIENKIPASGRSHIWLFAEASHVIWAPGGRMSEYYKVTTQTKTILQVKICEGE